MSRFLRDGPGAGAARPVLLLTILLGVGFVYLAVTSSLYVPGVFFVMGLAGILFLWPSLRPDGGAAASVPSALPRLGKKMRPGVHSSGVLVHAAWSTPSVTVSAAGGGEVFVVVVSLADVPIADRQLLRTLLLSDETWVEVGGAPLTLRLEAYTVSLVVPASSFSVDTALA